MESKSVAQCRALASAARDRASAAIDKLREAQLDVLFYEHNVDPFTDPPTPKPDFTSPGSLAAHALRDRLEAEFRALRAEFDAANEALRVAIEAAVDEH